MRVCVEVSGEGEVCGKGGKSVCRMGGLQYQQLGRLILPHLIITLDVNYLFSCAGVDLLQNHNQLECSKKKLCLTTGEVQNPIQSVDILKGHI